MRLEKIINGIRNFGKEIKKFGATRAVAIGISSAALMYSGGCESPEENIALATLGNMVQSSPNTSANDKVLGVGASTIGQMGYQMNTAKASRTEVNVNVYGEKYNDNSKKGRVINTAGGGVIEVDENGNVIGGWIVPPRDSCLITEPNGNAVTIGGLDYMSYINAHPEKYKNGWKVETFKDYKKLGNARSLNW